VRVDAELWRGAAWTDTRRACSACACARRCAELARPFLTQRRRALLAPLGTFAAGTHHAVKRVDVMTTSAWVARQQKFDDAWRAMRPLRALQSSRHQRETTRIPHALAA
jgi:hypothetical protein